MELTEARKEIINILEKLEIINQTDVFRYFRYKRYGIGQFFGWMEHKSSEVKDGALISNRLFGRFHAVAINTDNSPDLVRFEDKACYIISLANGLVSRYSMGSVFNVWELFGNEMQHITSESTQREKDECELRTLKRLLTFIDKLEKE